MELLCGKSEELFFLPYNFTSAKMKYFIPVQKSADDLSTTSFLLLLHFSVL
jgi:hypothetical protein